MPMRGWERVVFVSLLMPLTLGGCISPAQGPEDGPMDPRRVRAQVVKVVDGDTIRVALDGEVYAVRYIGIDAPETDPSGGAPEWMAREATEANRRLVEGEQVQLEKDVSETDRYGRLLRYVFLEDGTFVNAELVRLGYATAVTFPPDVGRQDVLRDMERQAREASRGLWAPTPPPS